jgi:hypothetical protein
MLMKHQDQLKASHNLNRRDAPARAAEARVIDDSQGGAPVIEGIEIVERPLARRRSGTGRSFVEGAWMLIWR